MVGTVGFEPTAGSLIEGVQWATLPRADLVVPNGVEPLSQVCKTRILPLN